MTVYIPRARLGRVTLSVDEAVVPDPCKNGGLSMTSKRVSYIILTLICGVPAVVTL